MRVLKNKIIAASLVIASAAFIQTALAGTNSPNIDNKQSNQAGRIFQGVGSGELTAKEGWRLGKQQGKIYRKERRFKADGSFTRRERAVIHRNLLKSSKSIYKQKHDRQVQGHPKKGVRTLGINKRQHNQKRRIGQGMRSGELTRGEARKLGQQQSRIQHKKRRFKADGVFTKKERARIHKSQNGLSKRIYRLKHNNRKRH